MKIMSSLIHPHVIPNLPDLHYWKKYNYLFNEKYSKNSYVVSSVLIFQKSF